MHLHNIKIEKRKNRGVRHEEMVNLTPYKLKTSTCKMFHNQKVFMQDYIVG